MEEASVWESRRPKSTALGTGRQGVNQKCGTGGREESTALGTGRTEGRESWTSEGDALPAPGPPFPPGWGSPDGGQKA